MRLPGPDQFEINAELLATCARSTTGSAGCCRRRRRCRSTTMLRWPGIFGDQSIDHAALGPQVLELARAVLDEFCASRGREGENWPP